MSADKKKILDLLKFAREMGDEKLVADVFSKYMEMDDGELKREDEYIEEKAEIKKKSTEKSKQEVKKNGSKTKPEEKEKLILRSYYITEELDRKIKIFNAMDKTGEYNNNSLIVREALKFFFEHHKND